ncbi:DUF1648 domain-containing protein [Paeniglutamicibacter sp. NPDC091659]|uniref:DUF1648 domain-containing protein n=1 Tax=Paeniglutamicibacter sp. NPDC091659 TaxID=3364389 RepID=UPI0037F16F28
MAEYTHRNRSSIFWALSLGTMGAAMAAHVLALLTWHGRLPDPMATHWNGAGVADGTGSFAFQLVIGAVTLAFIGVLMPLCSFVTPGPGKTSGVPLLAGLGNGLLVGICGLLLSGTVGQLDAPEALGTRMNLPVLFTGLALAILWGVISARLVAKSLPAAEAPGEAATASGQTSGLAMVPGTTLVSTVKSPKWVLAVLAALLIGMLVLALYVSAENAADLWLLVLVVAAVLLSGVCFLSGRVVVDDDGIRVYGGGLVKLLHVHPEDIHRAEGREITPAEFGGWGLRVSGAGVAFIVGKGPGVVVERKRGGARIYSAAAMEDATAMARLLNQLAAGHPDAGSRT